jgi:hypothetical protein
MTKNVSSISMSEMKTRNTSHAVVVAVVLEGNKRRVPSTSEKKACKAYI